MAIFVSNMSSLSGECDVMAKCNITYGNISGSDGCADAADESFQPSTLLSVVIAVIMGVILLVGIVGNVFVLIIIVAVKTMRTTVNRGLFSLALADLFILIFLPIYPSIDAFAPGVNTERNLCHFCNLMDRAARTCSVLVFIYVTVDRYMAICHPLKPRFWSVSKSYVFLVLIWVSSLISAYPYLYISVYEEECVDNMLQYFCYWDFDSYPWALWYDTVDTGILFYVALPILFGLNGKMVYKIRISVPKNESDSVTTNKHNKRGRSQVVVMLMAVVVLYMVTQLPIGTLLFLDLYFPHAFSFRPFDETAFGILWLCRLSVYVNSAANPIIYFCLSTNFREGFVHVFSCRRKRG